jgi:hypothetical protein
MDRMDTDYLGRLTAVVEDGRSLDGSREGGTAVVPPVVRGWPAMHATLFESLRHGFTGGPLSLEAFLIIKSIKLGAALLFLVGAFRELRRLM